MTEVEKQPKKEFLMMLIILLRKAEQETGKSLVEFLESFEEEHPEFNPEMTVDAYDDKSLRKAIKKYCLKLYPIKDNPNINVQDLADDDKTAEEVLAEDEVKTFDQLTPEEKQAIRDAENEPAKPLPGFEDDDENLPPVQRVE